MSERHDSGTGEVRAFELHGARIGVRIPGADADRVEALAADLLPAGARWTEPERLDEICEVPDGDEPAARHDAVSALDFAVAEHATERVFLHAGVVAWEGRAIVIPGRSLSGKTTLTAALVRAGATFYSDEFAPIDREGRVWPHARPLSVRAVGSTGPGQPVPVEELGFEPGREPIPVGLIVSTRHVAGATWQPDPLDAASGLLRVLDNAVVAQTKPELALSFLAPVTARARVLDGVRGDADETARRILQEAGRSGASEDAAGGEPTMTVAFAPPVGLGLGPLRHLLIRIVLATRHAAAGSTAARWATPTVALGAIPGRPSQVLGGAAGEPLPWSALFDLEALGGGSGVVAADADLGGAGAVPGLTPVEVQGGLDDPAVTEALAHAATDGVGASVVDPDRLGWGGSYGSLGFWAVVRSLHPNLEIRALAERLCPSGPFLGVHWRRGSYAAMQPGVSPTPAVAADQIGAIAQDRGLTTVLVATDALPDEVVELRARLARAHPDLDLVLLGEVVPIELAELARELVAVAVLVESTWFVGTRGSASTSAVREERIARRRWLPEATWSVLCGDLHHPPRSDDPEHGPIWELPVWRG